ncbi:MAG: glycosyltransferase family 2 protein [Planctomycetota bacterium]
MNQVDVSVLIVGYGSKDLMDDCLRGLYEHTAGVEMEVLFLDCSDDGSVELIAERFPQVRLIPNTENLGFGRGNNVLAREARGEFVLLLNPDTLVEDNAVGRLVEFALSRPDGGVWGGLTVLPTGEIDPGCRQPAPGLRSTLLRLVGRAERANAPVTLESTEPIEVASPSGAFMMLRRETWDQLGGFDESFFMYCEETDLCYRVKQAGHKVLLDPKSRIVHLVGSGAAESPKRMLALTKGATHFNRKHFGRLFCAADHTLRWMISFTRYAAGWLALPVIGAERGRKLRQRHADIVFHPGSWSRGWPPQAA